MDLIRRAGWSAKEPTRTTPLRSPDGVAVHWNGPKVGTHPHRNCPRLVRAIQAFHMGPKPKGRAWADIAYSTVTCEHGTVFEGRGPGHRTAANGTDDANDRFYAIMYLGGEGDPLTAEGMRGLRDARRWLIEHGGAGPLVRPHSAFDPGHTACPGERLRAFVPELVKSHPPAAPEDSVALTKQDAQLVVDTLLSQPNLDVLANRVLEVAANGKNRYGLDAIRTTVDLVNDGVTGLTGRLFPPEPTP